MTTITLKYPIDVAGEKITSLNLRRVTGGDLELVESESTELKRNFRLISLLAEITPEDVRKIDAADLNALSDKIQGFLA